MPKTQELPGGAAPGPPAVRVLRLLRSLRSNFQVFWQGVTYISGSLFLLKASALTFLHTDWSSIDISTVKMWTLSVVLNLTQN